MTTRRTSKNAGETGSNQFKPGNKFGKGRPEGSRNRITLAMEKLLEGEAENLTRKVIEKAMEGDSVALRLCFERLYPPRKGRPISFELPKVETIDDVMKAQGVVVNAVAVGDLTPDEGQAVSTILEAKRKAIETEDLERRIAKLEKEQSK